MEEIEEKREHRFEDAPLPVQIKLINEKLLIARNEELKAHGLTFSQFTVMMYLKRYRNRRITQKELCEAMHVTHPTIIGLIGRMEEKGLVTQQIDEDDRRYKLIKITEKGLALMSKSREDAIQNDQRLVVGLNEDERQALCRYLCVIYGNIVKEEERGESPVASSGKKGKC